MIPAATIAIKPITVPAAAPPTASAPPSAAVAASAEAALASHSPKRHCPTMYHTITPLLLRRVILAVICVTGTLSAKNPPHPAPTPDPALELSPTQDDQIQRINNLFAQQEKPLSDALKKARKDYERAINAHPVDNATVQEKAAAVDKAAALLATAEALHRANVLILLTPEQRKMVATFELTGKVPGNPAKKKSTDTGN
jgi:Spy/CpxP family protein refolding chaperone